MNRKMWRTMIIDEDILVITELKQRLVDSEQIKICGETSRAEDIWALIEQTQPELILLGSLKEIEVGVLCQQIRFYYPQIFFIAACSVRELHWEPFLRNLGIWVIGKPVQPYQLEMLVSQLSGLQFSPMPGFSGTFQVSSHIPGQALSSTPPPHTYSVADQRSEPGYATTLETKQFITVYGPKGGVGKTFLSRELAVYFALQKKAGRALKVLAVDFNLDLGTIATSLNLPRTPNLFTWIQEIDSQMVELVKREGKNIQALSHEEWQQYAMAMRLSPRDVEKYVVIHPQSNLHVLTSPREIRQSFDIKDYHIYLILETLKRSDYDIILIDTAPDTTDATIQALFFAHRVIMVGNPVVDAIENIQRMLKLLREAEFPEERIQICINRLQRREMFTLEEMRAYFQLHPSNKLYTIPDDEEVKKSINTGMPIVLHPGRSAAKEAIETLAKSLVTLEEAAASQTGRQKEKTRASFLSWLRK